MLKNISGNVIFNIQDKEETQDRSLGVHPLLLIKDTSKWTDSKLVGIDTKENEEKSVHNKAKIKEI